MSALHHVHKIYGIAGNAKQLKPFSSALGYPKSLFYSWYQILTLFMEPLICVTESSRVTSGVSFITALRNPGVQHVRIYFILLKQSPHMEHYKHVLCSLQLSTKTQKTSYSCTIASVSGMLLYHFPKIDGTRGLIEQHHEE